MQGGGGDGDRDDLLRHVPPDLEIGLEDLDVGAPEDHAASSATYQKPMPAQHTRHGVTRGDEITLILNIREHI